MFAFTPHYFIKCNIKLPHLHTKENITCFTLIKGIYTPGNFETPFEYPYIQNK